MNKRQHKTSIQSAEHVPTEVAVTDDLLSPWKQSIASGIGLKTTNAFNTGKGGTAGALKLRVNARTAKTAAKRSDATKQPHQQSQSMTRTRQLLNINSSVQQLQFKTPSQPSENETRIWSATKRGASGLPSSKMVVHRSWL